MQKEPRICYQTWKELQVVTGLNSICCVFRAQYMKNTSWSFSSAVEKNIFHAAIIISPLLPDNGDNITL